MSSGKYQFHSWARRGISSHIIEKDTLGKSTGSQIERARIPISVNVNSNITEKKDFSLFGPGDITGINSNMIIRTSPLNGIADYEPNLLPYIEFYDEDFPFRYTPASAATAGKHLRPWITLLVLKETEFIDTQRREPLRSIRIINKEVLPPQDQLHLWAHMHSNLADEESNFDKFLDQLEENVKTDPDGVYSRLISPRKLDSKTQYHAFLVPSFETGRLAGLAQNTTTRAQASSFLADDNEFPVYYHWNFRTGQNFDFEYLVKQLKPRVMDKRVGARPMDCSRPGYVRADSPEEVRAPIPEVLQLEGAIMAADAQRSNFNSNGQKFSDDMEKLVNLNRSQLENTREDPFVSVPYYGMYHAMRKNTALPGKREVPVFDPSADNWYNALNKNPIYRVPAGFGKRVVQENQERFMDIAWKQLEKVQAANNRIRWAQFSKETMLRIYSKTLLKKNNESYLLLTQAVSSKVMSGQITVKAELGKSLLEASYIDPAFRRITRSGTSLIKGIDGRSSGRNFSLDNMIKRVNKKGSAISSEVAENFSVIPKLNNLSTFQPPASINNINVWSVQSNLQQDFAFNLPGFSGGLPSVQLWGQPFERATLLPGSASPALATPTLTSPASIISRAALPALSSPITRPATLTGRPFRFNNPLLSSRFSTVMAAPVRPLTLASSTISLAQPLVAAQITTPVTVAATADISIAEIPISEVQVSADLLNATLVNTVAADQNLSVRQHTSAMKTAYSNMSERFQFKSTTKTKNTVSTARIRNVTDAAINPANAYLRRLDAQFKFPPGSLRPEGRQPANDFLSAMAWPDIAESTYRHLLLIDKEFLLPNLKLIENNTLSLLKTNQKFIESYLVGLNYEMGKELLSRGYPTDSRGTYFRQFWDVSGFVTPDTTPADAESMKDIIPIHRWKRSAKLGENNARDKEGDTEQLVFVIRGDLLKKFPNAVIYAQKALKEGDKKIIRTEFSASQEEKEIRFPQFQAEIEPDIKLLGFDLSIDEALGTVRTPGFRDRIGWFFVIAEVPGEPQFGMDISAFINTPGSPDWNDLSWKHLPDDLKFVQSDISPSLSVKASIKEKWGESSSDMAAILLQRPVMMAIHASEMLDQPVVPGRVSDSSITLREHLALINPRLLRL